MLGAVFHDADEQEGYNTAEAVGADFGVGPVTAGTPADEFGVFEEFEVVLDPVFAVVLGDDPSRVGGKEQVLAEAVSALFGRSQRRRSKWDVAFLGESCLSHISRLSQTILKTIQINGTM